MSLFRSAAYIREHYDAADVVALVREIMQSDAETYGHQFPAYRDDPLAETLRAVENNRPRALCPGRASDGAVRG